MKSLAYSALMAMLIACEAYGGESLVLITAAETPPLSFHHEKTGEIVGVEIDIAREVAAQLGKTLEVRECPFPELLPAISEHRADMAASGITITEGRSKTVDFSIPYRTEGGMFLYRAGEEEPTMISAELLRVATMDASSYDFYLCAHEIDSIRYETYEEAVEALESGAIDAIFYNSCAVVITARDSGGKLKASRLELRENFGFAVPKGDSELKRAIDETIERHRFRERGYSRGRTRKEDVAK